MDSELRITHSIKEIDPAAWDALSRGQPFSSHQWHVFGEAVLKNSTPTYMLVRQGEEPLARAAFWLKRQEWLPISSKLVRTGVERTLRRRPLFVCETPLACFPGLILPATDNRAALLDEIARTAHETAKESRALCALFGYISREQAAQAGWPSPYEPVSYSDPETVLPISWPEYAGYLKHLAKSTRRNIRLHCQEAGKLGIEIKVQGNVTAMDEAIGLIRNVESHHRAGHRPWSRAMLENMNLVDSRWISAWSGKQLLGCCSLFGDGTAMSATLLGLDYHFPQWIYVYYQLIYALVRSAIEAGCKELYGGGGAYELKRRLGFQKLPDDTMVVAPIGWFFTFFLKAATRLMKQIHKNDPEPSGGEKTG